MLLIAKTALADDVNPPMPVPVGRVVWVKGSLTAVMPNKEERKLQRLSIIYLHDMLITDPQTYAQVVFTDNTLMTFRPGTKFYVDQYTFHPGKNKLNIGTSVMDLIEGGFRTITGLIAKTNPPSYQIRTPVATIGVRGTDYTVALAKNGELFIGYYAGEPCVTSVKKGSVEMCLDTKTPYANISVGGVVTGLTEQPGILQEKLEIIPAKIALFNTGVSGTVTSFCISQ